MRTAITLRLTFPLGQTALLALALLVVSAGVAEAVAGSRWVRLHSKSTAHVDNSSRYFEARLLELDRLEASQGHVECIFLGSSMTYTGYSKLVFERAVREVTGQTLECANVGIHGMTALQAGEVARLLAGRYHPRLVIFGTSARDYSQAISDQNILGGSAMTHNPWMDYRLRGVFSLEGWLIDHSYAYRNWLGLRDWYAALGSQTVEQVPVLETPPDLTQPPDPVRERLHYRLLADYAVAPAGMAGLEQVLDLEQQGITVLVAEMPIHPTFLNFFGHGEADQRAFLAAVSQATQIRGIPFFQVEDELQIASDGWLDRNHLNDLGAVVFSRWLAHKVAEVTAALPASQDTP